SPDGPVTILNTDLTRNAAGAEAPALYFETSDVGSLHLAQSQVLTQASPAGDVIGIVNYGGDDEIVLHNVLIAGTTVTATTPDRGLIRTNVESANGSLVRVVVVQVTAAGNQGLALLDVQAVPFLSNFGRFDAGLTNTLAVDLPALFHTEQGGSSQVSIAADHTLTESVAALTTGSIGTSAITLTETVSGLANLGPTYRPERPSAAIDAALELGITVDASRGPRSGPADIGALEAEPLPNVYLPALLK
ncbi:MAG: hypothetical protein JNL73_12560, partial [Anaerolineales bacterium]|nr:hypothetical protein [Anaerolineales bacterium]